MSNVLFINACPRPDSRTLKLAKSLISKMDGEVRERDLFKECPDSLTWETLQMRDKYIAAKDFSQPVFAYAREFAQADAIVIAAPYWDLSFPAVLKSYLENVSVAGLTFRYSESGIPTGLCKAQKLYYVTTSGGYVGENDFGFSYVKALAGGLFGITNIKCICAEGMDISDDLARESLEKAEKEIAEEMN